MQDAVSLLEQIDFSEVLKELSPVITCYVTNRVIVNYNFYRSYFPRKISRVSFPPELKVKYNEFDINKIESSEFKDSIINFAKVLESSFNKEELINFYNNINEIKIKGNANFILNNFRYDKMIGGYDKLFNSIRIIENPEEYVIYHELFHMASSSHNKGIYYCGFEQSSFRIDVPSMGSGLNEGYTNLLVERYFKILPRSSYSYECLNKIAENLEKIIGDKKMTHLYMTSNLKGLVKEMCEYAEPKDAMKFIAYTDFVLKHLDDIKLYISQALTSLKEELNNDVKEENYGR